MKAYLNTLNERERWMLIAALVCLVLYCYYLFLYAPISKQLNQRSKQLTEKVSTLNWMQTVRKHNHKPKAKKNIDNSQLLTIMTTQLKKDPALKFPYQLQQTGSGDIQLTFEEVPFNTFISWLNGINEQYTVTLKQFNAERSTTAGKTRIMILISASS